MRPLTSSSASTALDWSRIVFFQGALYLVFLGLLGRLFYWQVIKAHYLKVEAQDQYERTQQVAGQRGSIFTADGHLLVGNQTVYRLFAQPPQLSLTPEEIKDKLTPILLENDEEYQQATESAKRAVLKDQLEESLITKLQKPDAKWISLMPKVDESVKEAVDQLEIKGVGFEPYQARYYPEASLAAQVTGFLGKNKEGEDVGYFGIEGALDKELKGRSEKTQIERDALGFHLFGGRFNPTEHLTGRDVVLTIRRDIQMTAEAFLQRGIERYGAKAGEIVILEPNTGHVLAAASWPTYDQATFSEFPGEVYKNPSLTSTYEPGSVFKTLTVAAGIDAGVIEPDTICTACDGPRVIGKYTIRTWNNEYHPDITMTDALAKSDNTAMIFVTDKLGKDKFVEYIQKFGIGDKTYLELQEDTTTPFPDKWGPVELATASFGQGISATSMQMVRAVSAIANKGVMMRPQIVAQVEDPSTGQLIKTLPVEEDQVISAESAAAVTQMMIKAAEYGEAQWTASKTHHIAGKTGTSQVAIDGKYDPDKTIVSFVGFTPPENPRFIMLVKLQEPTSSPWAAETAAPLWYALADKLYLLLGIPPDR